MLVGELIDALDTLDPTKEVVLNIDDDGTSCIVDVDKVEDTSTGVELLGEL